MPEDVQTKARFTVVLAIFATLAIVGGLFFVVAVDDFARAEASHGWPTAEGVVLSGSTQNELRYAYVASGRSHEGARLRYLTSTSSAPPAMTPGETIIVHFNPRHPADAVLAPGGHGGLFAAWLAGAGALIFFGVGGVIRTVMKGAKVSYEEGGGEGAADAAYAAGAIR